MKDRFLDMFGHALSEELLLLLIGEQIGKGEFRVVYELGINTSLVIKAEPDGRSFHNVREYEVWREAEGTKWEKWLCPIMHISHSGSFIVQPRVAMIERVPDKVPSFLQDLKPENWGALDGKPVCIDYGYETSIRDTLRSAKLINSEQRMK